MYIANILKHKIDLVLISGPENLIKVFNFDFEKISWNPEVKCALIGK